ncbi:putative gonadotropin-releasing hormone II receptor [Acanthopagrus latus]|uniref:putative gonadotropin-releasing hormone II receptor n=1 Tax=Acanthopagrus latus TaxID=8177 RepID=UPI00187C0289|nr:putative gonadotropin-releasing hormone II receptor [Acanthopagrus latus]XP_036952661.1 putative gonadotropin-releasing hormone II receptor [Acanthopagrus latus]XP_036952662.1 putative gonadotropin-releasing hormone II receptor [Acanthopagrus latus]XP_036952663.1 putative gonadotropin-releasing hormone II receptor [Acanthopagrus latus]
MNTTLCDSAAAMYHLTTDHQLNASCNYSTPPSNWTAGGGGQQLPTFTTAAKVRVVITCILCGVSAFCNLAVLWAAHSDGKRKSHVRVLIINLTVADLLVTFIVMPVDAVWNITVQWLAGDFACRLLMFLKLQAMYSCAFVTVVISLDRQSAILNPLAINKARKRNRVMLTVAWGMSVLLSVPQMFLFHNVTIVHPEDFTQCTTRGSFVRHWHETAYNMFTFFCLFLLPLVIMITCYTRIFCEISKRLRKDNLPSNEVHLRRSKNNIPRARMRTLKMSIVIVSSFIICWTPYYLLGLWYWFFPDDLEGKVSHSLTHILFIFGLVNACLDPVIYGLFTIHFRTGLRRYYRNATTASDLDNNTVITGSFVCAANSLQLKREVSPVSQERFMLCSDSHSREESTPSRSSFLTADNDAERDSHQFCSDSII